MLYHFRSYNGCTMDNAVKLLVTFVKVTRFPLQAVCEKAGFSVYGYLVLSRSSLCENGSMPSDRLASI